MNTGKHKVIYETNEVDSDVEDPYFGDVATEGNYVYIPCQQQNGVLILDMDYDAIKKKSVILYFYTSFKIQSIWIH